MATDFQRVPIRLTATQLAFIDEQREPSGESRANWIRRLIQEQIDWAQKVQRRRHEEAA